MRDSARIVGTLGWVAAPADARGLAEATVAALAAMGETEAWQRRKAAAREHIVARFGIEAMVTAYHRVWQGQADPRSPGYG